MDRFLNDEVDGGRFVNVSHRWAWIVGECQTLTCIISLHQCRRPRERYDLDGHGGTFKRRTVNAVANVQSDGGAAAQVRND